MTDAAWTLAFFIIGMFIGAALAAVHFLRTFSYDISDAYTKGRQTGHAEGFAQGRQVSNKAAQR